MERLVWQRLQTTGTLTCPRDKAESDPLFQQAYAWMRSAMAGAGIQPPAPGLSPWWSWVRREPERGMPHAEDLEGLDDPVVLQLAVPAVDLVPSCFDLWHYVLNQWYVAASEEDALDFEGLQAVCEDGSPAAAQLQARLRASWCAVFDLDWSVAGMGVFEEKSIQACFWTLRRDQVTAVLERNDLSASG